MIFYPILGEDEAHFDEHVTYSASVFGAQGSDTFFRVDCQGVPKAFRSATWPNRMMRPQKLVAEYSKEQGFVTPLELTADLFRFLGYLEGSFVDGMFVLHSSGFDTKCMLLDLGIACMWSLEDSFLKG